MKIFFGLEVVDCGRRARADWARKSADDRESARSIVKGVAGQFGEYGEYEDGAEQQDEKMMMDVGKQNNDRCGADSNLLRGVNPYLKKRHFDEVVVAELKEG